jgi:hypothetical protein
MRHAVQKVAIMSITRMEETSGGRKGRRGTEKEEQIVWYCDVLNVAGIEMRESRGVTVPYARQEQTGRGRGN